MSRRKVNVASKALDGPIFACHCVKQIVMSRTSAAPSRFCPTFERSLQTCGFIVKSWERNGTKPNKVHGILARTKESGLKDFPDVNTPLY